MTVGGLIAVPMWRSLAPQHRVQSAVLALLAIWLTFWGWLESAAGVGFDPIDRWKWDDEVVDLVRWVGWIPLALWLDRMLAVGAAPREANLMPIGAGLPARSYRGRRRSDEDRVTAELFQPQRVFVAFCIGANWIRQRGVVDARAAAAADRAIRQAVVVPDRRFDAIAGAGGQLGDPSGDVVVREVVEVHRAGLMRAVLHVEAVAVRGGHPLSVRPSVMKK
jgi:hypothetical protein